MIKNTSKIYGNYSASLLFRNRAKIYFNNTKVIVYGFK